MKCKFTKYCGGCSDVNCDYVKTLDCKQKYLIDIFSKQGKFVSDSNIKISNIISNYYPYKYRNKIQLAFTQFKGKTIIGFFENNSTNVVDIDGCILNGDWSFTLISILREYISRFKIRGYKDGNGVLRYAHARCVNNNLQLTLCVATDNFAGRDWLYKKLCESFNSVSFYLNINRRTDRLVFDKVFKFVAGKRYLEFDFCGVKVSIEPASFLQVNLNVAEKMYKKALELLEIKPTTKVLDLYCGVGITSIMFGRVASSVIAIEENPKAIENAIHMAKNNNVNNIKFVVGKCEDNLRQLKNDDDIVAFVDPARNGLDKRLIDKLRSLNVRKIVYMSCNPETMIRDINYIVADNNCMQNDSKYRLSGLIMGDMFAFCGNHVEVLCDIQKQNI